jgi:hypothetical protein
MARGQPQQVRLSFKQSLKGCSNAELQKRLRALHEELAEIDQDLIVTSSLDTVAKDLIAHALLLHKEKGVKAYLACCLADILRLYAPEAPYTQAELKVRNGEVDLKLSSGEVWTGLGKYGLGMSAVRGRGREVERTRRAQALATREGIEGQAREQGND